MSPLDVPVGIAQDKLFVDAESPYVGVLLVNSAGEGLTEADGERDADGLLDGEADENGEREGEAEELGEREADGDDVNGLNAPMIQ